MVNKKADEVAGQTGSIVVDVNHTTSIQPRTTVPCSYYLSAQSYSASKEGFWQPLKLGEYMQSFGHSPECASFAAYRDSSYSWERAAQKSSISATLFPEELGLITSACPDIQGIGRGWTALTPAGVYQDKTEGGGASDYNCCGQCKCI